MRSRDPFDVPLKAEQQHALALWLCDEIARGQDARASAASDVEYWWRLYEQARTRTGRNLRPDAADLTSYLPAEQVDSIQARVMRTVFTDPIWTVEGWGDAAERAPFVEEFHQWKAEEERLQGVADRLLLQALVEPRGLLEIAEGVDTKVTRKRITVAVETDPVSNAPILGEDGAPILRSNDDGSYVEAQSDELGAETVIDTHERVRTGPVCRILPYRDSLILPGHARDREEIYGYGKRFWRRIEELRLKAKSGIYDVDAVAKIQGPERETDDGLSRSNMSVQTGEGARREVELWELLVCVDLDQLFEERGLGRPAKALRGMRWYLTTVHVDTQQVLRVQHDDLERSRFVPVILFPRADRVTEGYSFVGHKQITITEEHTAWRNMTADRAAQTLNAPMKRMQGALWDPDEQPMGAGSVIDVRDMNEVQPMVIPDQSAAGFQHIEMLERTAQRVGGINDIASGQVARDSRTLGEIQMATEQSFVRMDLIVRRFQEAWEDVAQIRHAIWKRTLAEGDGVDAPSGVLQNLEGRGVSIDQYLPDKRITAALLDGAFRFKPHGSVETADPNRLRSDFIAALQVLPRLIQAFPLLQSMFASPQAARAMGRQFLRVMRVPNAQAMLGSPSQDLKTTQQVAVAGQMPAPPMGLPGMSRPMGGGGGMPDMAALAGMLGGPAGVQ